MGLLWGARIGLARIFGSREVELVNAGALGGFDVVSADLRGCASGVAVGAVVFWGFLGALIAVQRFERRRRVELRRRARAEWQRSSR